MANGLNAMTWPEERVRSAEVREWIRAQTPGCERVDGPTRVYRVNGWGVTGRFAVKRPGRGRARASAGSVVCKIAYCREDASAPRVHQLLRAGGTGCVPELLAWQARGSQTWLLFVPFEGQVLSDVPGIDALIEAARTLARIQRSVASLPRAQAAGIPRWPAEQLPALFDEILRRIREEGLCCRDGDALVSPQALAAYRENLADWVMELSAVNWPASIDHHDVGPHNAARLPSGRVLIYDWEGAAMSCPFFSMDHLLEQMGRWDQGPDAPSPARQKSGLAYTPDQLTVRRAYLEEWPRGTLAERERAFDVALCLSRVQRAYQQATAFGWMGCSFVATPEGGIEMHAAVARNLERAMRRWETMLQSAVSQT